MTTICTAAKRPPVYLVDSEADTLSDLAWGIKDRQPEVCTMLLDEIGRAKLYKRGRLPNDVVTMASCVEFLDEGSGARRSVQIVYPNQADASEGRISVLTLVGAGLIGLKAGHAILWPDRMGRKRRLELLSVRQPVCDAALHG